MSWATRRRTLILVIIGAVAVAAVSIVLIATLYESPACTDLKQNGDETGVDCGGSCALLCSADFRAPDISLAPRALSSAPGRTDVIAYVENKNPAAGAKDVGFVITLYGADGILVASKQGTVDLPPGTLVPVYVPDFLSGYQQVARAFLELDPATLRWQRYLAPSDKLKTSYVIEDEATAPRITATVSNPSARALYDVKIVATAFGADGNAIAASQTIVPLIPAMGDAAATFTWNAPFAAPVARVDVLPVIPLVSAP